ncbi:DUF2798 domain-containing protein [Tardiphaga sp.]|jgi:hypothetical protein|uniref:DUF2798 domain-containing protein n=1 Tax=Tardiphaga sp. TaxID=1926292 RepID=UPI0037D9EFFC
MTLIPARYSHLTFGVIQSGLTSGVSAAVASVPFWQERSFLAHWLSAWVISWLIMLPIVVFAAPFIKAFVHRITCDVTDPQHATKQH